MARAIPFEKIVVEPRDFIYRIVWSWLVGRVDAAPAAVVGYYTGRHIPVWGRVDFQNGKGLSPAHHAGMGHMAHTGGIFHHVHFIGVFIGDKFSSNNRDVYIMGDCCLAAGSGTGVDSFRKTKS